MTSRTNPFKGPKAYEYGEKIYGRDKETFDLLNLIESNNLTLFYSKSGVGKTSLLNASLIPILDKSEVYLPIYIRLGAFVNYKTGSKNFSHYILQEVSKTLDSKQFNIPDTKVHDSLFEFLYSANIVQPGSEQQVPKIPVIILDQLEIIFTLNLKDGDVEHLFTELSYCLEGQYPDYLLKLYNERNEPDKFQEIQSQLRAKSKKFRILFSFREEYLFDFENCSSKLPSIKYNAGRYRLMSFKRNVAIDVIDAISEGQINLEQAEKIVDHLLSREQTNISNQEIDPFLLSLVCNQVWDQIITSQIEVSRSIVDNAISHYVARVYDSISPQAQEFIEKWLVTVDNKRTLFGYDLALEWHISSEELDALIEDPEKRLLNKEMYLDNFHVQIIHDRLVPSIVSRKKEREELEEKTKTEQIKQEQRRILLEEQAKLRKQLEEEALRERREAITRKNKQLYIAGLSFLIMLLIIVTFSWMQSRKEEKENRKYKDAFTAINSGDSLRLAASLFINPRHWNDTIDSRQKKIETAKTLLSDAASHYRKSKVDDANILYAEKLIDTYIKIFELNDANILDSILSFYEQNGENKVIANLIFNRSIESLAAFRFGGVRRKDPSMEISIDSFLNHLSKKEIEKFRTDSSYFRDHIQILYNNSFRETSLTMLKNYPEEYYSDDDYCLLSNLTWSNAEQILRKCLARYPGSCECNSYLSSHYVRTRQHFKLDSILHVRYNWLDCKPSEGFDAWVAEALVKSGKTALVPKIIENILREEHTSDLYYSVSLNNLAWHMALRNVNLADAKKLSLKSIKLDNNCNYCWDTLAEIYLRLNEIDEADKANNRALSLEPGKPEAKRRRKQIELLKNNEQISKRI